MSSKVIFRHSEIDLEPLERQTMNLNKLTAISPIDGRYRDKTDELAAFFSEYALIKYRVKVEVAYFIALCEAGIPSLEKIDKLLFADLRALYENFTEENAQRIKEIEKITNTT